MSFRDNPDYDLIARILDDTPEYCSCSCHASQHSLTLTPAGGERRCKERWHNCDPVYSMGTAKLQSTLHDMLKLQAQRFARQPYRQSSEREVLADILSELRTLNREGVRHR